MLGIAGSSYALFAAVWALMCLLSGAVVTDAMLRDPSRAVEAEFQGDVPDA